ncbi:30S ribosomal protein S14 [Pantanalinema sp. GBBB05]|uniref:30S ribosomal protein S14 n=2 Tax=Pantanalinema TaxID=1620699 RepID=UPI003D818199
MRKLRSPVIRDSIATSQDPIKFGRINNCVFINLGTTGRFMAKKSMIEREKKRKKLVEKYAQKRQDLLEQFSAATSQQEKITIHRKIQQLPRNSAPTRMHNRCWVTGRPRGYYRDFGLSRNVLREMAHEGLLPGVVKSSW